VPHAPGVGDDGVLRHVAEELAGLGRVAAVRDHREQHLGVVDDVVVWDKFGTSPRQAIGRRKHVEFNTYYEHENNTGKHPNKPENAVGLAG